MISSLKMGKVLVSDWNGALKKVFVYLYYSSLTIELVCPTGPSYLLSKHSLYQTICSYPLRQR